MWESRRGEWMADGVMHAWCDARCSMLFSVRARCALAVLRRCRFIERVVCVAFATGPGPSGMVATFPQCVGSLAGRSPRACPRRATCPSDWSPAIGVARLSRSGRRPTRCTAAPASSLTIFTPFSASHRYARAVWRGLFSAQSRGKLIGSCNPMLGRWMSSGPTVSSPRTALARAGLAETITTP